MKLILAITLLIVSTLGYCYESPPVRHFNFDSEELFLFQYGDAVVYLVKQYRTIVFPPSEDEIVGVTLIEYFDLDSPRGMVTRLVTHMFDCKGKHMFVGVVVLPVEGDIVRMTLISDRGMTIIPDSAIMIRKVERVVCDIWIPTNAI